MQFLSCRSSRLSNSVVTATKTSSCSSSSSCCNTVGAFFSCCSSSTSPILMTSKSQFSISSISKNNTIHSSSMFSSSSSSSPSTNMMPVITPASCTAVRTAVHEVRPGDWLCANCGENNFRFRTHCNLCSKPRSPGQGEGGASVDGTGSGSGEAGMTTTSAGTPTIRGLPGRAPGGHNNKGVGDWTCPVCQSLNFKFRSECFSCREARPASERPPKGLELTDANMKPGDWKCPECNGINFRGRSTCFTCRSPRIATVDVASQAIQSDMRTRAGGRIGGGGGTTAMKRGDWLCQSCSEHNFADRPSCFRCGQPRGDAKGYQPRGASSGVAEDAEGKPPKSANSTKLSDQVMEGDWMCIECGVNNFRRRSTCVKCKTPKAGGSDAAGGATAGGTLTDSATKQREAEKESSKIADPLSDDL